MAVSFFAPILIFVPLAGLAVLGLVLAVVSRRTRLAGVLLMSIAGMICLGGFALLLLSVKPGRVSPEVRQMVVTPALEMPKELPSFSDTRQPNAGQQRTDAGLTGAEPLIVVEAASNADTDITATLPTSLPRAEADQADLDQLKRYLEGTSPAAQTADPADAGPSSLSDIVPPERPPWVDRPAFAIGDADYVPIDSGPYATRGECRRALEDAMQQAVDEYVEDHRSADRPGPYVAFDTTYIKTHLRHGGVYEETVQASFGPMRQQHALLKFGKAFRDEIDRRWQQLVITSRLAQTTLLGLGVLAGLATVFTYLRVDTATRGYYSGRLQFAAGAVILGLVALGISLARWIPWL